MGITKVQAIVIAVVAIVIASGAVYAVYGGNNDNKDSSYSEGAVTVITPVDYKGNTVAQTYTEVPDRVVVGCCTTLNLLLYLGLGDRIVGIYYDEEAPWAEVQDEYDQVVKRIGADHVLTGNISQAVLTDWEPDCIIGWVAFTDGKLGSPAYWNALGCNVWALRTMVDESTIAGMTEDYNNVGKVFDVRDKTNAFIESFTAKAASLQGKLAASTLSFAIYDGAYMDKNTFWFYGDDNFIGYLLKYLGATNVFPEGGSKMAAAMVYDRAEDIQVLFFVCYGSVHYDDVLAYWQADKTLAASPAIANGNTQAMKLSVSYGADPSLTETLDYLVKLLGA